VRKWSLVQKSRVVRRARERKKRTWFMGGSLTCDRINDDSEHTSVYAEPSSVLVTNCGAGFGYHLLWVLVLNAAAVTS